MPGGQGARWPRGHLGQGAKGPEDQVPDQEAKGKGPGGHDGLKEGEVELRARPAGFKAKMNKGKWRTRGFEDILSGFWTTPS